MRTSGIFFQFSEHQRKNQGGEARERIDGSPTDRAAAIARELDTAAYHVSQNRALMSMVRRLPTTPAELVECWGWGETKASRHGERLLAVLEPQVVGGGERLAVGQRERAKGHTVLVYIVKIFHHVPCGSINRLGISRAPVFISMQPRCQVQVQRARLRPCTWHFRLRV